MCSLSGTWRAVLQSPGGELPFSIVIEEQDTRAPRAAIINGAETLPFTVVERTGPRLLLGFEHYDSYLEGTVDDNCSSVRGEWSRRAPDDRRTTMAFTATKGEHRRFLPRTRSAVEPGANFAGSWNVTFTDDEGTSPAQAIFRQDGAIVQGTFLTPVGDYRYIAGSVMGDTLRLSVFDGAHAFLFHLRMGGDGRLSGDFWSRDVYHATFTAARGPAQLGDPYHLTQLTNDRQSFTFDFPDVNGVRVTQADPRFENKALIVHIFGTWCPNCNDSAELLVSLYRQYRNRGLAIVGLANEFSTTFEGRAEMVRAFSRRYGIDWPMLIVGPADKAATSAALTDIDEITSYPTTLFIDRQGKVVKIHTGFTGPATGAHYDTLKAEYHAIIEQLLTE